MKIAIHGRQVKDDALPSLQEMFHHLQNIGAEVQLYKALAESLEKFHVTLPAYSIYERPDQMSALNNFVFSTGGDGTLLDALTYVGEKQLPILGINTGRLGFLATTQRNNIIDAIEKLRAGNFHYDERTLISLTTEIDLFDGINFALNEFGILKTDSSSMIVVHTYLDNEYVNSYWADGLLVATPTGSTGYSLSCGGPLVAPRSNNFVITPVNPHNLNVRPLVVQDSCEIMFKIESRSQNYLAVLDSRSKSVDSGIKLTVKKAPFKAKLIELPDSNFFKTLRGKLNWGLDMRN